MRIVTQPDELFGPPPPRLGAQQMLRCAGCGKLTPQIGSKVRLVDDVRRRVGPCCAKPIGAGA